MMRYYIKTFYICMVACLSRLYSSLRIDRKHIVFLMTFKEDQLPIIYQLSQRGFNITVFAKPKDFHYLENRKHITYYPLKQSSILKQLAALATAKVVFIDTYYLMMAGWRKKEGQTVIQTWHAAGALKKFGLEDHSVDLTQKEHVDQYCAVYQATDKYLVGGQQMADCFEKAFGARYEQLLSFGSPRLTTYRRIDRQAHQQKLKKQLGIQNKVAVYLPTYREGGQMNRTIDKETFETAVPGYTLLSKYHPTVSAAAENIKMCTLDLVILADLIITDYSSLAIEASSVNTPTLFYVYDEADYEIVRGLNKYYYDIPQEYKAYDERTLYERINEGQLQPLFQKWHQYNTSESLNQVVNYVEKLVRI
ncbi:teichoic acid glycerol-phosphate primase TarB [Staphylococcus delphini]|uniref:teichoic acid glycerol-phosphate primase TarB n=1 Tax=Staphylococcus delphini TaxID=53344 RepID=UPI000BBCE1DB|nr:teichoic acid glycerol-phosphate primase TarB [Staphylococcus delphini]PCF82951.1 CDP-glycerol--poly(glycerophosphate) glycerophosphotransferase [Staphylococcus delphini]